MASKSKRRSGRRASIDPLDLIRRNFERGDFKQALKDARVWYRKRATPKLRSLLEHVYAARAEQLSRQGLREDSRRIAQELLDLGVTEPSVQAGLPDLLLSVGMMDSLPAGINALTDEDQERLRVKIVDQSVLRPQDTPQNMPEIKGEALRIRAALEAVERGEEAVALAHLREIPRQSPLADWKLFVRGLLAYYRRDEADMLANWDRLDENRAAAKIAAPLKCVAGVARSQPDSRLAAKVNRLERQAGSLPVLGALTKLQRFAVDRDWHQVLRTLRTIGGELEKLDGDVYRRVVGWLCGMLIEEEEVDTLERLARFAKPPLLDPHWYRARAMVLDEACDWEAHQYWRKYMDDLDNVAAIAPSERDLVRGMIHVHLARDYADAAGDLRQCRCGEDHSPEIERVESRALKHFNQCQRLAPTYAAGPQGLAEFHMKAGRPQQAVEVVQRWLERMPDDVDALLFLGKYYISCGAALEARQHVERARQLKPLDKEVGDLLWGTHVQAARQLACQGHFDQARNDMASADRLRPGRKDDYDMLARKAVLEIKAGRPEAARTFLEEAQEALAEPTALWLVMAIEATRFELPNKEAWLYEKRWQDALKRRCRSETAGLMCKMLNAHLHMPQPYECCDQHAPALVKYVRRCSRVKWQAEDLRSVCEFLATVEDYKLLSKFLKRGLRSFPDAAHLHWLAAKSEIAKGPWMCDRDKALDHLDEAVRLGTLSDDPRDKDILELAKEAQTFLNDSSLDAYEYDDEDELDDDDEGQIDELLDDLDGIPRDVVFRMLDKYCRQAGLDPEAVMEELERRLATRTRHGK
jgi:tetratricopeptide (TPR) repeat protein